MPGAAEGLVVRAHRDHRPTHIANVTYAVGHVRIGEEPDLLAIEKRAEEPLANERLRHVRPEQIRGAHADRAHLSRAVRREQFFSQQPAGSAARSFAVQRCGFAHRDTAMRPAHVQVLRDDELGAGRRRASHDAALERRELLWPAVVIRCVGAVVDVSRARADPPRIRRVCGVGDLHVHGRRQSPPRTTAGGNADVFAVSQQRIDDGQSDRATAEDDVQLARGAHRFAEGANTGVRC